MKEGILDILEPILPDLTFRIRRRGARVYKFEDTSESMRKLEEGDALVIKEKWPRRKPFPQVGWKQDFVVWQDGTVVLRRNHSLRHPNLAEGRDLLTAGVAFGPWDDRDYPERPGQVDTLLNWSGQYQPDFASLKIARNAMRRLRVPLSKNFKLQAYR